MKKLLLLLLILAAFGAGGFFVWRSIEARQEAEAFERCLATEEEAGRDYEKAVAAFEEYLEQFSDGPNAASARAKIGDELPAKIDDREFEQTRKLAEGAGEDHEKARGIYMDYLRRFPEGRLRGEAAEMVEAVLPAKIDDREFERAEKQAAKADEDYEAALAAYLDYLKCFPAGKHQAEASEMAEVVLPARIEKQVFGAACAAAEAAGGDHQKAMAAFKSYLKRYPEGSHSAEARSSVEKIEAIVRAEREDDEAYARAKETEASCGKQYEKAVEAYQSYLKQFPEGGHVAEVREHIKRVLPAALVAQAKRLKEARELDKALILLQKAYALSPTASIMQSISECRMFNIEKTEVVSGPVEARGCRVAAGTGRVLYVCTVRFTDRGRSISFGDFSELQVSKASLQWTKIGAYGTLIANGDFKLRLDDGRTVLCSCLPASSRERGPPVTFRAPDGRAQWLMFAGYVRLIAAVRPGAKPTALVWGGKHETPIPP